jgi:hypothetical protein
VVGLLAAVMRDGGMSAEFRCGRQRVAMRAECGQLKGRGPSGTWSGATVRGRRRRWSGRQCERLQTALVAEAEAAEVQPANLRNGRLQAPARCESIDILALVATGG